jgi:hypothetical protein
MTCLRPLFRIGLGVLIILLVLLSAQSAPARATTPATNPGETIPEQTFFGWMTLHVPLIATASLAPEPPPPPAPPAVFGWLTLPTQVTPGSIVPVRINLQNAGLGAADGVRVTFPYDSTNFRLLYTQLDAGAGDWVSTDSFPTDFTVQFGSLNPGATRTGTVFLQISPALLPDDRVRFRARYTNGACGNAECPTNDQRVPVVEEGSVENPFDIALGSGPAGSRFTFPATGFIPGEPVVTWLNRPNGGTQSLPLAGNADGVGNISFRIDTNSFTPGFYSVVAHGQRSSHEMIGRFEVTATNQTAPGRSDLPAAATAAAPTQATGTGQIGGVVREATLADSGPRLAGVLVIATATESGATFSTLTDALGGYRLTNLPAGAYTVRFEPRWSPVAATRSFTPLDVADVPVNDAEVTPVAAELVRGATISGAVSGDIGGLGEITVLLLNENETVAAATTGADGSFSISGVPVGSYTVRYVPTQVLRRATSVYAGAVGAVEVPDADPITDVAVILPRAPLPGQISGTVTNSDGSGLAGILMLFHILDEDTGSYRFVTSTLTDGDGNYSSGVLAAGTYRVRALPEVSPGAGSNVYQGAAYRADDTAPVEGTPISIAAGAGRDDIDLMLDVQE